MQLQFYKRLILPQYVESSGEFRLENIFKLSTTSSETVLVEYLNTFAS
jgi:hypothetical protein